MVLKTDMTAFVQEHECQTEVGQVVQKLGCESDADPIGPGRIVTQLVHHLFFTAADNFQRGLAPHAGEGRNQ